MQINEAPQPGVDSVSSTMGTGIRTALCHRKELHPFLWPVHAVYHAAEVEVFLTL